MFGNVCITVGNYLVVAMQSSGLGFFLLRKRQNTNEATAECQLVGYIYNVQPDYFIV